MCVLGLILIHLTDFMPPPPPPLTSIFHPSSNAQVLTTPSKCWKNSTLWPSSFPQLYMIFFKKEQLLKLLNIIKVVCLFSKLGKDVTLTLNHNTQQNRLKNSNWKRTMAYYLWKVFSIPKKVLWNLVHS